MKKLTCLLLAFVLLAGLAAAGLASLAPASAYMDPDYERENEDDLVWCTEQYAYERGRDFYKVWWIANHGNFRKLDFEYCPPYYSTVLQNRRDTSYKLSEIQWRIMTFNLEEINHSNKEKAYLEALLFNLLYDENSDAASTVMSSNSSSFISTLNKNIKNLGFSMWKDLSSVYEDLDLLKPLSEMDIDDPLFGQALHGITSEFDGVVEFAKLIDHADTLLDFIDKLATLQQLAGSSNYLRDVLLGMRARMQSSEFNEAYYSTLTNFASYLDETITEEYALKIFTKEVAAREFNNDMLNTLWSAAAKKNAAVWGIDVATSIGKFASNAITGIDDRYNAFNELEVYFDMEQYLRQEVGHLIDKMNQGDTYSAEMFMVAYPMLKNMYNIAMDCYEDYIHNFYREGFLNDVLPFLGISDTVQKYRDAMNVAETMRDDMNKLFLYDEAKATNAYAEACDRYNPELVAQIEPEEETLPAGDKTEEELQEEFEALKPTFGMELEEDKTMTNDLEMYGSIDLKNGTFNLNGHNLTIYGNVYLEYGTFVGQGTIDVKGSVYQSGGTLQIPGGCTFTVGGDYVMTPNSSPITKLSVEGGSLTVGGNLIMNDRTYSSDYANLSVTSTGEVQIGGSLTVGNGGYTTLSSGALRVGGSIVGSSPLNGESGFTVRMTGTGDVRVENLSGPKLIIENAADRNITFAKEVKAAALSGGDMQITPENLLFGAAALQNDVSFSGPITIDSETALNSHDLTVNGDLTAQAKVTADGVLTVIGSLLMTYNDMTIPSSGEVTVSGSATLVPASNTTELKVNGGTLTVGGGLTGQNNVYSSDYACLSIQNNGSATFGGPITMNSHSYTSLSSGTLVVPESIVGASALSGNSSCTVTVVGSGDARVENLSGPKLVVENAEDRNITFAKTVNVAELSGGDMEIVPEDLLFGAAALQNDVSFSGPVTIDYATALNGHVMTVNGDLTTNNGLTADGTLTVVGSLTENYGDVVIPSGGEVTVSGSATLVPASNTTELKVNGGTLTVGGGLTGQNNVYSTDYACLSIQNNGSATFGGPITMNSHSYTSLSSGALTLVDSIVGASALSGNSSCTVTVAGTGDARVENLSGPKLVVENAEDRNITFAKEVKVAELSGGDMAITPEELSFSGTLTGDLAVNGSMTIDGDVNLGDNTLAVNGNLRQSSGTLDTGSGTLNVSGSYKIASLSSGADALGYGILKMTNASARVNVGGDMLVWTDKSCTLTNGVLTIGGHFTQKGNGSFVASGSHKTVLNGTKLQRVTFERTSNKFNILELMQYEEMYIFSPDNCWNSMRVYCDHAVTEVRNAVEATCTEDGYSGDVYCALCGDLLEQGHVIEAQGHTIVTDPPVDPTCETDGHTYGRHCSVCGKVFVQPTVIPALGHDWGDWVVTTEPTATTEGEETRTCRNDPSHTETRPIPATGGLEAPTITGQPQSVTTSPGTTVRFTVAAAGEGLTYQWQFCAPGKTAWNNSGMTGNKTATLTVEATTARSGQRYRCVVTNAAGSVESEPATLTVVSAPKITSQPQSVSANVGDTVQFTVAASGTNLTYQWQYKSPGTTSWYNSGMTGAKTATLTVQATAARNGQQYRCKVTNDSGAVYSNAATLTVTSSLPVITGQPQSVTTSPGKTVTFTVTATGADLTYQWQYQAPGTTKWYNSGMTGAKTKTLTVEATAARNGQQYRCVVKNANGSVESSAAKLTVLSKPAITAQPQSVAAAYGDAVRFTVQATGGSLTYQWQYKSPGSSAWKDSGMTGNKTATLRVTAEKARNGQQYRCVIKNAAGQVISDPATLTTAEQAVPLIMVQPTNKTAAVGDTVKFTVQATGGNLTYQWQFKAAGTSTWYNSSMTGAKTATLQVSATAARSGQQYRCIVTNALGTVTSDAAKLTVK